MADEMATETRTVHFLIDPALRAFFAYLEAEGRSFDPTEYDLFAAGYRWRDTEPAARHGVERAASGGRDGVAPREAGSAGEGER